MRNEDIWESMSSDPSKSILYLAELNQKIPSAFRLELEKRYKQFEGEDLLARQTPFVGPLKDSKGRLILNAGEHLTDAELRRMCWYVEGVVGEVPASCVGDRQPPLKAAPRSTP